MGVIASLAIRFIRPHVGCGPEAGAVSGRCVPFCLLAAVSLCSCKQMRSPHTHTPPSSLEALPLPSVLLPFAVLESPWCPMHSGQDNVQRINNK